MSGAPGADHRSAAFTRQFAAALAHLNANNLPAALQSCEALRRQAPNDAAVTQLQATISVRLNALEEAANAAERSLRLRPGHVPTLILAGRIALARHLPEQATAPLREAATRSPTAPEPAFLLLQALLGSADPALDTALAQARRQHPNNAADWQNLALALQRARRPALALAAFTQAATADPQLATSQFGRGLVLREAGDMPAAHAALSRSVALDPSLANAWFALGLTCQDLHNEAEAATAFQAALAARADFPEAAVNLGIALQRLGRLQDALVAYRTARRLRPETLGRIAQALTTASTGVLCLSTPRLHQLLDT